MKEERKMKEDKKVQHDPYQDHRASCKECQQLSPCKVGHDILLELAGWKVKDK